MNARTTIIPIFMGNHGPLSTADKIIVFGICGLALAAIVTALAYMWWDR